MKRAAVLVIALAAAPLLADVVQLRGGGRLTGEILEQTDDTVTIDIGAGRMTVPMTTVVGIDKGVSPLQEYRARAATLQDSDVASWLELGRWATERGLSAQARDAYTKVHSANPDEAEANRALGLVLWEGRWIPEEESFRAQGYVKFEGEWMTPAESAAILSERDARAESERQAIAAEVKASVAEIKEREEKEAREEEEERRRHDLPQLGEPLYWGYGPAPSAWAVGGNW